jgi:DNA topoisomerase-6 subunit B
MSRGQQGIGISAAGMYGLITTGKPMVIHSRPSAKKPAHLLELAMNTKTNRAEVTVDTETEDFPPQEYKNLNAGTRETDFLNPENYPTGTSVAIELEGRYQKGRGSVDEFLELTAIANPHAKITFVPQTRVAANDQEELPLGDAAHDATPADAAAAQAEAVKAEPVQAPNGVDPTITTIAKDGVIIFPRGTDQLPPETKEIQPHPKGIELGILIQMLNDFEQANKGGGTLYNFLQEKFCRISPEKASEFCQAIKCHSRTKAGDLTPEQIEALFRQFQEARLPSPPTNCLAPIGMRQLLAGLLKGVKAALSMSSTWPAPRPSL